MMRAQKVKFSLFIALLMIALASKGESLENANSTWAGSKYEIECTMCSACDNPCGTSSPPPPSPPPPSPSPPPPPSPSSNCPPPPSPPTSGGSYYSPPPPSPSQSNYPYSSPPPPSGVIGNYYPPPYKGFPTGPTGPTPPPPNPIVPYFPYYSRNPPPPSISAASLQFIRSSTSSYLIITMLFTIACFF